MSKPIKCILNFYCKRPKNHYKTGKFANILKDTSPKYNINNKDLDNMVKFVLDALNDKLYTDDSLIFEIICSKLYSEIQGGVVPPLPEVGEKSGKGPLRVEPPIKSSLNNKISTRNFKARKMPDLSGQDTRNKNQ